MGAVKSEQIGPVHQCSSRPGGQTALSPTARTHQHQRKRSSAILRRTSSIDSAIFLRSAVDRLRLNFLNIAAVSLAVTRLTDAWRSSHASVSPFRLRWFEWALLLSAS